MSFILDGIEEKLTPPLPVSGNGYEANLKKLPRDLKTALSIFENSAQMHKILPPTLREMFIATKEQELRTTLLGDLDDKRK